VQSLLQWKSNNSTYFECVSVALVTPHAMCMSHIVISGLFGYTKIFHLIT